MENAPRDYKTARGAGDSLRGFPWPGQPSPALPTLCPRPSTDPAGVCCALPPSQLFLLLPKSTLGSLGATISSLSLQSCFSIPSQLCQWLSLKHPRPSQGWRDLDVFSCAVGCSKSCLFLETPTRVPLWECPCWVESSEGKASILSG